LKHVTKELPYWIVSEAALFAFLFYVQYLLRVEGNLWISSLILSVLLSMAVAFCPVIRKCYR